MTLSKSQIDKLGDRLRRTGEPTDDDLQTLTEFVASQDPIRSDVERAVRHMSPEEEAPTSRLKTNVSILEKLRRQRTSLFRMQDIVGVRLITRGDRNAQDAVVRRITARWPKNRIYDRRRDPQRGYRAVHVVVHVADRPAEIQVRTLHQHMWAELFEKLADKWGRDIRYGARPPAESRDVFPLLDFLANAIDDSEAMGPVVTGDSLARIARTLDSLRMQLLGDT